MLLLHFLLVLLNHIGQLFYIISHRTFCTGRSILILSYFLCCHR